jgi:hypothetical protein
MTKQRTERAGQRWQRERTNKEGPKDPPRISVVTAGHAAAIETAGHDRSRKVSNGLLDLFHTTRKPL